MAGVLDNGNTHGLAHGFSVLGYHVTGSGTVFLYGIAVGAVALFGLWLLLAGMRHTSRRGRAARRGLRQSQRETAQSRQETAAVSQERDDLIGQRDTARAYTASQPGSGARPPDVPPRPPVDRWSRLRRLSHRLAPAPAAGQPDAPASRPASEVPAPASHAGMTGIAPVADAAAGASDPDVAGISPAFDAHATAPAPAE